MNKIFQKTLLLLIISYLLLIGTFGCSEFIETDLTNDSVNLKSPIDSFNTSVGTVTFWWDQLEGTTSYRLQIVSPSFDSIQQLVVDSVVKKNIITFNFLPGRYEWGVVAFNNSSNAIGSYRHFIVDTTSVLAGTKVILLYPPGDAYLSISNINFQWYKLENAEKYIFELKSENENGEMILPSQISEKNAFSLNLKEGAYYWTIQALNRSSGSMSSGRKLYIDTTPPSNPVLYLPLENDTPEVKDVVLIWKHPKASLAPISDSVFLSKDSIFSVGSILESALVDTSVYNVITNDQGLYFWRVRSIDKAGNISGYSKTRKFRILNGK